MFSPARGLRHTVHSLVTPRPSPYIHGVQDVKPRPYDPLKILFCGTDDFSIASLRTLWKLSRAKPDKIQSIDVVCRPDKRVGRGLKKLQQVPIKGVANELGLKLHQIDTFTRWQPPDSINLVIAVSFGLLVPARILDGAKYGGLNVHPSLLPDLRGPAPIQHAIMKRRQYTGVTLQTMHPTRFDSGAILAQTRSEEVAILDETTTGDLTSILSGIGAEILGESIQAGIFVAPIKDLNPRLPRRETEHAPKITPEDRHIDWDSWTADDICRRDRAVGPLWDLITAPKALQQYDKSRRMTMIGPWTVVPNLSDDKPIPGKPITLLPEHEKLGIYTVDGQIVSPSAGTLEGSSRGKGVETLVRAMRSEKAAEKEQDA